MVLHDNDGVDETNGDEHDEEDADRDIFSDGEGKSKRMYKKEQKRLGHFVGCALSKYFKQSASEPRHQGHAKAKGLPVG